MATYEELRALFKNNKLRNRVEVACIVAAETIRGRPGNVPAATGAGRAAVLGKIVPGGLLKTARN